MSRRKHFVNSINPYFCLEKCFFEKKQKKQENESLYHVILIQFYDIAQVHLPARRVQFSISHISSSSKFKHFYFLNMAIIWLNMATIKR